MAEIRPPKMGPGRRVVFRPNHSYKDGFGGFATSDEVRDVVTEVAGDMKDAIAAASSRSEGPGPHMADRWRVRKQAGQRILIGKTGHRNRRVRVDIYNRDIAAAAQEFGFRGHERTRVMMRIAGQYGDFHDHGEADLG